MGNEEHKQIIDGDAPISELDRLFGVEVEGKGDEEPPSTISAWILDEFDGMPEEGDGFAYENLLVTVLETEFRHIKSAEIECVSPVDSDE